jgi:phosphatidylinositol kinase/protein kinase (PI-3  family)
MMVNAVDIGGVQGLFHSTRERVISALRANTDSIMAMLEAFILDILVIWILKEVEKAKGRVENGEEGTGGGAWRCSSGAWIGEELGYLLIGEEMERVGRRGNGRGVNGEQMETRSNKTLNRVEEKLEGCQFGGDGKKCLEEQVTLLIEDAMDTKILCQNGEELSTAFECVMIFLRKMNVGYQEKPFPFFQMWC